MGGGQFSSSIDPQSHEILEFLDLFDRLLVSGLVKKDETKDSTRIELPIYVLATTATTLFTAQQSKKKDKIPNLKPKLQEIMKIRSASELEDIKEKPALLAYLARNLKFDEHSSEDTKLRKLLDSISEID